MSGIVGILRTDGAPIEPTLIQRLTEGLAHAGPDAQTTWYGGRVAFGHTLLRTTYESACEDQPLSLDGQVWIVADARLDARRDLLAALDDGFETARAQVSDVELTLRAYLRWGESCVEHLLGDFAFAIWDQRRQRLFCARDHMGVKPFYYARVGHWLLLSNASECLRRHEAISHTLHDLAIADFLLFGFNQDPTTTCFHDIRRLPSAHALTWSDSGVGVRRYWTLPIDEPLYYRKDREYVDQFNQLLRQVVSDRLRTDRVGIFMSGGLDSPALAATAREALAHENTTDRVQAFTMAYHSLIPDSERHYARLVAEHLTIPIHYYTLDENAAWAPTAAAGTPEPGETLTDRSAEARCYAEMAAHSRVALYGEGPDNALLYEWQPHLKYLWRKRRWGRLVADAAKHSISHKRVPLLTTIPHLVRARWTRHQDTPSFPRWIAPALVRRLRLRERWDALQREGDRLHPVRPKAYASLLSPLWQSMFETFQPSYTRTTLEVRHPYVDVRMLQFLLRVPSLPWCRSKHLLRCALRGVLPETVRLRPKRPLECDPDFERVRKHGLPPAVPSPPLEHYGDASCLASAQFESVSAVGGALRFVALSYWLRRASQAGTAG